MELNSFNLNVSNHFIGTFTNVGKLLVWFVGLLITSVNDTFVFTTFGQLMTFVLRTPKTMTGNRFPKATVCLFAAVPLTFVFFVETTATNIKPVGG